jgi:hypothetical protein
MSRTYRNVLVNRSIRKAENKGFTMRDHAAHKFKTDDDMLAFDTDMEDLVEVTARPRWNVTDNG